MSIECGTFSREQDLPQRPALFDDCFPETRGTPVAGAAHYDWKFHGRAESPPSWEYSATEGKRLVGYYAAIPYRYLLSGKPALCGMVCDVMTHSSMRGRGVFTRLGKFATAEMGRADLDLLSGYPIRPEVLPGHLKVGWKVGFRLPIYLRPLRSRAILMRLRAEALAPLVDLPLTAGQLALGRNRRPPDGMELRETGVEEILSDPGWEDFIADWGRHYPNHLVKDAAFLRWRYGAPGTRYRALAIHRGPRLVAAAFTRVAPLAGISCLAVLDFMAAEIDPSVLGALHGALARCALVEGAEGVALMAGRTWAQRHRLLWNGYLRTPHVFRFIFHDLGKRHPAVDFHREGEWPLMWVDSDDL